MGDDKTITIRFTREMWLRIRRLQERDAVKSFQDAVDKALKLWLEGQENR